MQQGVNRVLGSPFVFQQVYIPESGAGIQNGFIQPFGVRISQVYNPPTDSVKGVQYFYYHPFSTSLYSPTQIDGEYEVIEPPVGSPTFMGGRIGVHRSMKNKQGKFDERDLIDLIQMLTSARII